MKKQSELVSFELLPYDEKQEIVDIFNNSADIDEFEILLGNHNFYLDQTQISIWWEYLTKRFSNSEKISLKKQSQDEGPIDMISNDELDTAMDEGGEGLDDLGGGDLGGDIGGGMPGDLEGGPGGMEGPQAPMPVDDVDWDSMNIVWDEENDLDAKRRRGDDGLEIDYSRII